MSEKLRVAVVFGGKSGEHEVSLRSAASVIEALPKDKYDVVLVGITKTGRWVLGDAAASLLAGQSEAPGERVVLPADPERGLIEVDLASGRVRRERVDIIFPVLHGTFGEDGTIQGLFEMADLPYVGAGVAASAVGMDKVLMRDLYRQAGLPVVDTAYYLRGRWRREPEVVLNEIEARFGYPCFVKPANLGSSVGVSKAHDREELAEALTLAARYDRKVVVEQAVNAREIECSVLGNDEPVASVPGEIVPSREFYDYAAKYIDEDSQLVIPARLDDATAARVRELAVRAFKAIDCAGMGRIDFFLDRDDGRLYVNEINTIPGFTSISMYPKLWEASGMTYSQLLDRLLQLALERHREKRESETSFNVD
jgi:D-alanine-D-alanine ligase